MPRQGHLRSHRSVDGGAGVPRVAGTATACAIVVANSDRDFPKPEMVKRRLCVMASPKFGCRSGLCAVIPATEEAAGELPQNSVQSPNPHVPCTGKFQRRPVRAVRQDSGGMNQGGAQFNQLLRSTLVIQSAPP